MYDPIHLHVVCRMKSAIAKLLLWLDMDHGSDLSAKMLLRSYHRIQLIRFLQMRMQPSIFVY